MIVVVGTPTWGGSRTPEPTGLASAIALAIAARGANVELVGRVGDDEAGDALLIALARGRVGHVAVLRDPARATVIRPEVTTPAESGLKTLDPDETSPILGEGADHVRVSATPDQPPVLEAADVAMALRYLTEFSVLVVTEDVLDEAIPIAVEAATYAAAALVVLVESGDAVPRVVPQDATVFAVPDHDAGSGFAAMVAAYAVALDAGKHPRDAFAAAVSDGAWESAPE